MGNTNDMREYEYEIIGSRDKVIAHVWWNGKKVDSDNANYLTSLKQRPIGTFTLTDGKEYLERLPQLYRSGYIRVKKVK